MAIQSATQAASARAFQARDDRIESCQEADHAAPHLSGWRAGAALGVLAAVTILVAVPVLAALDPSLLDRVAVSAQRLAVIAPVMLAARALVFVVALAVISRPDGRQ
jgi:hypothetical protein